LVLTVNQNMNLSHLQHAIRLALEAEKLGNLPIGAVITLDDRIIGAGGNAMLAPVYQPGRHAEIEALKSVPVELWPRANEMTCYTTLEPCLMCLGTLLIHGLRRIVFGANDPVGGGGVVLSHLPRYFKEHTSAIEWLGPVAPAECDPLFQRALARLGISR
jgi:tRNA(adenine34) deaminase